MRRCIGPALAVFSVGLLIQVPIWLQYREDPFSQTLISDAFSYDQWGRQIASKGLSAEPVFHQAPLFPILLSLVYRAMPEAARWEAATCLQVLLTSFALALLVPIGRFYLDSTATGVGGALLVLLHGPFVFHSFKLLPVPLALATQALALVALGLARERASSLFAILAGAALGLAALARSEFLLFTPFALLSLAFPLPGARVVSKVRLIGSFLCGLALVVAPVTLHNFRHGDFVLVASSGGENLFIGNKRGAQGDYTPLHPQAGDLFSERLLARRLAEGAEGRELRPSERSAYWRRRAVEEIVAEPFGWLRLEVKKLGRVLHPGDPTDIYSFPLERDLYLTALHALPLPAWLLLGSGLAGIAAALAGRARRFWPLAALVATHFAVLLLFFVNSRLRLPLLFALAPFGGFALIEGARVWREGRRRPLVAAAALGLFALGIAGVWMTRPQPRDRVRLASVLSIQNRLDEGLEVLEPDLTGRAAYGLALDQAGWLLQKKGDLGAARDAYRKALAQGLPEGRGVQTRTRLAVVLEKLGDVDAASREHDRAVADPSANAGAYYERGMFRLRQGDRPGAIRDLEEAARRDPSWDDPAKALAAIPR